MKTFLRELSYFFLRLSGSSREGIFGEGADHMLESLIRLFQESLCDHIEGNSDIKIKGDLHALRLLKEFNFMRQKDKVISEIGWNKF